MHLDRKSPLWRETRGRFLADLPTVRVVARPATVRWGHASQIAATLKLLDEALAEPFDIAHLISGADWPVAHRGAIVDELAEAGARDCRIEAEPGIQAERMGGFRLDSRWLRPDGANPLDWYRARLLKAASQPFAGRRGAPWGPWCKGAQWWSLPRDVCADVHRHLSAARRRGRFAGTVCADEHAVQTFVAQRYPQRVAPPLRFVRFPEGASSPRLLDAADLPAIAESGAWFARKCDEAHDPFFRTALPLG